MMGKILLNRGPYAIVTDLRTNETTYQAIAVEADGGLRLARRVHKTATRAEAWGRVLNDRFLRMRLRGKETK